MRRLLAVTAIYCLTACAPAQAHHYARRVVTADVIAHPAGCPRTAFCGCGVSVRVFGRPIRELFLARNWYRYPRAPLAAGNVIVKPHHVQYIESIEGGTPICYDPNSGGHLTRRHACQLAGGTIVHPGG